MLDRDNLFLFQRPGRLCARLPLRTPSKHLYQYAVHELECQGQIYSIDDADLSPDGHRVAIFVKDAQNKAGCLIYGW